METQPIKRKRGRPKVLDPKSHQIHVKLNSRESSMLRFVCDHYGISKSEFVTMAISTYFDVVIREETKNGGTTE